MTSRLTRQRARKRWRIRALAATVAVCAWKTGEPGRDAVVKEAITAQEKIKRWFTPPGRITC